jgi:hypothetical protein
MKEVGQRIGYEIKGITTAVHPFGFRLEKGQFQVFPDQFDACPSLDLCNCFVGWVENIPIIRFGSINNSQKVKELLFLAGVVHRKIKNKNKKISFLRVSTDQINSIKFEWDAISLQHRHFAERLQELEVGENLIHISTGLEKFYASHPQRNLSQSEFKTLHDLSHLVNMEAWTAYCAYYYEHLKKIFSEFKYDAVDSYTLEKYIIDFQHEVQNLYLVRTKKRLMELETSLGTKERETNLSYREVVQFEKELIIARKEIQRMVRVHYDFLCEIIRIIQVIEEAHPELKETKYIGKILQGLLAFEVDSPTSQPLPFTCQQILLQLLNDEMGVISAVNCDSGVDRTNLAFAIRLATVQLKNLTSIDEVINLTIGWNPTIAIIHQYLAVKEVEQLEDWADQIQDLTLKFNIRLMLNFWELFLENLQKVCIPITEEIRSGIEEPSKDDFFLSKELLKIMPPFRKATDISKTVRLVKYDPNTFDPVDLTPEGRQLIKEISM